MTQQEFWTLVLKLIQNVIYKRDLTKMILVSFVGLISKTDNLTARETKLFMIF